MSSGLARDVEALRVTVAALTARVAVLEQRESSRPHGDLKLLSAGRCRDALGIVGMQRRTDGPAGEDFIGWQLGVKRGHA